MADEQHDLEVQVAAEWVRFEGRLADRLASMDEDESLRIEVMTGVDDDELTGAAPYLQFVAWEEVNLRAEVAGNDYLDERYALSDDGWERLVDVGWCEPDEDTDELNFFLDCELRDADRVAMMSVVALREVFGCPHPSFLYGDLDEPAPEPDDEGRPAEEQPVVFTESREHLVELVDEALTEFFEAPPVHNDDGDIAVRIGESVVYVRVSQQRPLVELFTTLAVDVRDRERLALELDILNRTHAFAKFYAHGEHVVMMQVLPAQPFMPGQLRTFLGTMCGEVDQLAGDLVARVGGRRELQPAGDEATAYDELGADASSAMLGLLEMLHDGTVAPAEVAALFDHDRHELVCQLVQLRTGAQSSGDHDLEDVLSHLRGALRFIVERQVRVDLAADKRANRRHSQQLALMPEPEAGQATLDAGRWDQEVS